MQKKEKIRQAARYDQIKMENAIRMVSQKHDYHAPAKYGYTKERFASEVQNAERGLVNDIIIGNLCKAYIERSKFLTWRMNRITRWIDRIAKDVENKEKIEREKKAKENALAKTGDGEGTVTAEVSPAEIEGAKNDNTIPFAGLNRKQRRKLQKMEKNKTDMGR